MKRQVPLLTAIVFASATALMAQAPPAAPRSKPDQPAAPQAATHPDNHAAGADLEFARKVAAGGAAEVELTMMAEQKASSPDVRSLASRLHTDHMKANDELKKIASQKGWELPASPTPEQKTTKIKLEKLSGAEFDREFVNTMVTNHRANIPNFQREADKGADPDVKNFASMVLPTLKEHLDLAVKAQQALGVTKTSAKR
jgi:putative membrane protein